jgi:hypothetical protein
MSVHLSPPDHAQNHHDSTLVQTTSKNPILKHNSFPIARNPNPQLKSYIGREPKKKKKTKTKLPAQITIRPRGYQNAQPDSCHPSLTPAPSPWTHTTATATISTTTKSRGQPHEHQLRSHPTAETTTTTSSMSRPPPIRSNPPNRTRKLREEKKKKTHLISLATEPRSLLSSPPVLGSPLEHTKNKQPRAEETRKKKSPQIPGRFIFVNSIWPAPSEVVSAASARSREGSGAPQLTEFARRADGLRVCQGAPALPTRRGDLAGRFRGSG